MISRCFHYFQPCKAPQNNRVKKTAAYNFRLQSSITKGSANKFHPKAPKLLSWILPHLRFSSQAISITFWCSNFPCKKKGWGLSCKVLKWLLHRLSKPLWSEGFSNQQTVCFFSPAPQKKSPWLQKSKVFPRIQGSNYEKNAPPDSNPTAKSQMFKLFGVNLTPFCGWKKSFICFPLIGHLELQNHPKVKRKVQWCHAKVISTHDSTLPWLMPSLTPSPDGFKHDLETHSDLVGSF